MGEAMDGELASPEGIRMTALLALIPFVMQLLRGLGIIKDPAEEKEYRIKLLELMQQKEISESNEFAAFIKATSPDAQYVWPIINSVIAATRPAITWMIVGSIIASFWKHGLAAQITETLQAFSNAGTAGLLFLAIPAWWFFGRSIEKIVPGLSVLSGGNGNGNGNGAKGNGHAPVATSVPPANQPTPPQPSNGDWPRSPEQMAPEGLR